LLEGFAPPPLRPPPTILPPLSDFLPDAASPFTPEVFFSCPGTRLGRNFFPQRSISAVCHVDSTATDVHRVGDELSLFSHAVIFTPLRAPYKRDVLFSHLPPGPPASFLRNCVILVFLGPISLIRTFPRFKYIY